MPYRALITGVSGFVGGYLAEHLLDCGDKVMGTSPQGAWEDASSPELPGRVELLPWDVSSEQGLPAEARRRIEQFRPQVVYHLAALSVPEQCGPDEPLPAAWATNVEGTRRLLDLAVALPGRTRVLFVSSSHVYAPVRPESPRVDETAPVGPRRGYGRTKLAAEDQVRRAVARGAEALIVRSFPHTGPRQYPRMLLPQWSRQFASPDATPVEVYTLDAHFDLSDVRDVVRAYRLLAEHGARGQVYNVGSGVNRRTGEILELLQRLAGSDRPVLQRRPGFRQEPVADVTRVARTTGWHTSTALAKTVADTLAWWRGAEVPKRWARESP